MSSVAGTLDRAPGSLSGKAVRLCWGLVKGVAFLHKHLVAHRDIKPDNLVHDGYYCLKIIDFDVAVQLQDEDDEVDDYPGTRHWKAPEVAKKVPTYSPIKADRWSCGHVVLHLLDTIGEQDGLLRTIATTLKADDPQQRPSLLEWREWATRALPSNVVARTQKRDADVAELPDAKKPRLAEAHSAPAPSAVNKPE
ncbi:kinase-like domain-containing protein [Fomitopsis serialis]|uniref:kinase-like domain-containing protein n=1 Tax=Fomitopsis serialis TaxID=139415 RepID=UPI002007E919|nr:kinase-like domain-containing protein [Neoantrodia serialis]KAH9912176.1 kinase-like domain-containing protein [Neoantrodia serialis]